MFPIIIVIIIAMVLFFLWSLRKIKELHSNIEILRNDIEDLKRNQNKQKPGIEKNMEKPVETDKEELQSQKEIKEIEISEPEKKSPENTHRKEPFYLGMPNDKGFLKEESPKAGYFVAREQSSNRAVFVFVNDQAKINVIFKSDMEGKFYKVESGIALPGKALSKQTMGLLGKKGDFWAVLKPITIELELGN